MNTIKNFLFLLVFFISCSSDSGGEKDTFVDTQKKDPPIIGDEQGYIFEQEKMIPKNQPLSVDIIAYKHKDGLDIKAGKYSATEYQPMKVYQKKHYKSLSEVPSTKPTAEENNTFLGSIEVGDAAVVKNNVSSGYTKFLITEITGSGSYPQTKFTFEILK